MKDGPLAVLEEIRSICLVKIVPNGPKRFEYAIKIKAVWNAPILGGFGIISILFAIRHGGRTLSGERGSYVHILISRWQDMIPCVLRPDVGVLGKKSGIRSMQR